MKIFRDNKVYVQRNNIAVLNTVCESIPAKIFITLCSEGSIIVGNYNRFNFYEFDNPEIVEYFRQQDWIVDYDEVKGLNQQEMYRLGDEVVEEMNNAATEYNAMSQEEREQHPELRERHALLRNKLTELGDVYLFLNGKLKMNLPEGIEGPTPKKKGIKQFVKSIFQSKKEA